MLPLLSTVVLRRSNLWLSACNRWFISNYLWNNCFWALTRLQTLGFFAKIVAFKLLSSRVQWSPCVPLVNSSDMLASLFLLSVFKALSHSAVCNYEQQVEVTTWSRSCSPLTAQGVVMEASSHVPLNQLSNCHELRPRQYSWKLHFGGTIQERTISFFNGAQINQLLN